MVLDEICIYEYIKNYLNEIPIIKYKKGEYIAHSNENIEEIFFILEGNVRVECTTRYDKSFFVDELAENEFVGKISYMYDQNLFCDIIATSNTCLLKISKDTFKILQKNSDFLNIFFFKTSKRMYCIYKKLMMRELFKLEELLAFYILENSNNCVFEYESMYKLSKKLSISRKSLYNVLNVFIRKGYIEKRKNSIIVLERNCLYELSKYVEEFNETDEHDLKFKI